MRHIRQTGYFLMLEYAYVYFGKERFQKETRIPDTPHDSAELHVLACSAGGYGNAGF